MNRRFGYVVGLATLVALGVTMVCGSASAMTPLSGDEMALVEGGTTHPTCADFVCGGPPKCQGYEEVIQNFTARNCSGPQHPGPCDLTGNDVLCAQVQSYSDKYCRYAVGPPHSTYYFRFSD